MSKHAKQPLNWRTEDQIQGLKGQKLDMWGATMNLRGAKGENNTFISCEFHL